MKNKVILCKKCKGQIKDIDDLVVTNSFIWIVPYHARCFANQLKGLNTVHVGNKPINGTMGNTWTILSAILGIILLFVEGMRYLSIVLFLFIFVRFYSWFRYERHL